MPRGESCSAGAAEETQKCLYDTPAHSAADVTTLASARTRVVLLPGIDRRALGGSVRARNARVAARAGVPVVDGVDARAEDGTLYLLAVPPDVLINVALFAEELPEHAAWLVTSPGVGVVAGPAADVRGLIAAGTIGTNDSRIGAAAHRQVSGDALLDVSTVSGRRRAMWRVLKRTVKPTDGWVSRHLNRPISRLFSFVLLSLGLAASHASFFTLAVGLIAAVLALQPGYLALVVTGILFHLASVLDGVDGEMARATLTESEAGARLDAIVDQLTYIACFVGVMIGWAREGGGLPALYWTAALAAGLVLSLLRGGRFVARYAPDASFVFIDRAVRRAARDSGRLPLRMAAAGFSLLRRDLFAIVFLAVALTGRRALVPALVAFGILLANATLSIYRRELADAAVLEGRGSASSHASMRDARADHV